MITTAIPDGEDAPTIFALDVRGRPWDGTAGLTLIAEWDGVGMAATQSHAMRLERAPGVRLAREGPLSDVTAGAGAFVATTFTAVILGVVDEAMATAKQQLLPEVGEPARLRASRMDTSGPRPLARGAGLRGVAAGAGGRRPEARCSRRCARRSRWPSWPRRRSLAWRG